MKKIITVLSVLTIVLVCFCSCGKSEAVKNTEAKISALGEITLDKAKDVDAAEIAYKTLSAEEKDKVKNYDKLVAAREYLDDITDFCNKRDTLKEMLETVLKQYGTSYAQIKEIYDDLKTRNDAADDKKKAIYAFDEVNALAEEYMSSFDNATPSAVMYVKGFLEVNKDKDVKVKDIYCLAQLDKDSKYQYLFALCFEEDGEEKYAYASARFTGVPPIESFLASPSNFYGEEALSGKLNAVENANFILDVEAILAEVKA